MERCPLQLRVYKTALSDDHVMVDTLMVVVYRWQTGRYYIRLGHHRVPVVLVGSRFQLEITKRRLTEIVGDINKRKQTP